jgi:hypothetical protein
MVFMVWKAADKSVDRYIPLDGDIYRSVRGVRRTRGGALVHLPLGAEGTPSLGLARSLAIHAPRRQASR